MKRVLSLVIALMLALSSIAFSENASVDEIVINDVASESVAAGGELSIDSLDLFGGEVGNIDLGVLPDTGIEIGLVSNAPEAPEAPAPVGFEQTAAVGDVSFTITADVGAFPDGAGLSVEAVDADAAQAAAQSIGQTAQGTHHLYAIRVLDGDGNALRLADGVELPRVRVDGLVLDGAARVFAYVSETDESYEIEAEGAVQFRFRESAIYDIVDVEQADPPADIPQAQPGEEEQLELLPEEGQQVPKLEMVPDSVLEGDTADPTASDPVASDPLEAVNDLAYESGALNANDDPGATEDVAANDGPKDEDELIKALAQLPSGNNGFDLDQGAYIDANGSARKIVLTQMDMSLKNPRTGEVLEAFAAPLSNSYIQVRDDVILVRAGSAGLHEGDALARGDCDVYPGGNELKDGAILMILDAGKSIHAFYAASVTDTSITLGKEINVHRGIAASKLKSTYSKDFGPISYSWGDHDENYINIDKGTLAFTVDADAGWDGLDPYLDIKEVSWEVTVDEIDIHVDTLQEVKTTLDLLTFSFDFKIGEVTQGIKAFIEGWGQGDTTFSFHTKYGFYVDMYFSVNPFDWGLKIDDIGWIKEDPTFNLSKYYVAGELFEGLEYDYNFEILSGLFELDFPVKNGIHLDGALWENHAYPGDDDRNYWHECDECISGTGCGRVGNLDVDASVYYGEISVNLLHADGYDFAQFDYYDSLTFGDFDLTPCPHKGYRLNVTVEDTAGMSTEGAAVSYAPAPEHYEGATSATADKDGKAVLYAPANLNMDVTATMTSPHDPSWTISQTQSIAKQAKTEDLNITFDIPVKHVYFKNSQSGEAKQMPDDIEFAPFLSVDVALPDNVPELSGFQFTGWNTEKDGSGTSYAPGVTITTSDDVTLWAQWTKAEGSWYVVYNANGGTKAPRTQIVKQGQDATLSSELPEAGKMIFKGWTTNPAKPKVEYNPGDVLPYDSSKNVVVLYAVWNLSPVQKPIHITFDANGLAKAKLPADIWLERGGWLQLSPAVAPLGSGYVFRGWSEEKGSVDPEYQAGKSYRFDRDVKLYAIWNTQKKTTLTFSDSQSGGATDIPNPIVITPTMSSDVRIPAVIPQKSGRQFTGWNTEKDGSGTSYAPGTTITVKKDTTLWAQWAKAENRWFVVYDANGGTKAPKTQIVKQGNDATLSSELPEAGKMIFKGWTTDPSSAKVQYNPGDVLPYDSSKNVVVLYALWDLSPVQRPVHVTFDANGLAKAKLPADVWLERGGWLQLSPAVAPLGSAYVFRGWSEKKGSKEPEYHAGESYRFERDVKLYAIWGKQEVTTLTFKDSQPGSASGIPNPIVIEPTMSPNVRIPSAIPKKDGRQFTGWNTQKDGSGTSYAPGTTITLKKDTTLWAQWARAEDSWFVVYDANGGTKAPKTQIVRQGQDATLSSELPEAGEMVFKGWTTDPAKPKVEYNPGDVLPYDSSKNVVVLYAVWDLSPVQRPVHVTFDANGLAKAQLPADVWLERGGWLQLSPAVAPLGSAYVFRGWSEKKGSKEPEYHAGESYQFDRDVKLYAIWGKQEVTTLTFKDSLPGSATDIPNPIVIEPTMSPNVRIPSAIPQKSGRQFTGWNTKKDGSGSNYAPGATVTLNKDMTLWAQWAKAENSWFVVYDANGGTKAPKTQIVRQGQDATLSSELPEAGKMVFRGWTTDPASAKVQYNPGDVLPYDSSKNVVVLYALWDLSPVQKPIHITFNANGVSGAQLPADVWLERGGWVQLSPAVAPDGSDYTFLGWSKKKSSKAPEYEAGKSYQFNRDAKLYAIWGKQEAMTLTFRDSLPGAASGIPDPIVITPDMSSDVRIPDVIPQKDGRQFTGWNTKKNGSGRNYAPGTTITLNKDMTLWAQWAKAGDNWFVVYDANGGTKAPGTQVIAQGQDATLSGELPEAGKMVFRGWTTDLASAKVQYNPGDVLPYDSRKNVVVLYALWDLSPVQKPIHITFNANGVSGAQLPADVWLERGGWVQLSPAIAPLGSAYTFLGWSEKKSAKQPEYEAGKSYQFNRDAKLYAIWEKGVAPVDYTLLARMTVADCDDTALNIEWTKAQGATGYDVFFARSNRDYELKKTVTGNTNRVRVSGLEKRKCYKAYVKAWKTVNEKKVYIGDASPEVYAITGGYDSKYCNARSVKLDRDSLTMEVGDSETLKATVTKVKDSRKLVNHTAAVRYYSSDAGVARVDENGRVTAVTKGQCKIWAIAPNGVRASVRVTVK